MQNVVALSGWGQSHAALSSLLPEAIHVDYARHRSVAAALSDIAMAVPEPDCIVGWSLGGQLAVRAIAAGMVQPKKLVLIAAPFQFVKTSQHPVGMPAGMYEKFRDNFAKNPLRTLTKAWELLHLDDPKASEVRAHLETHSKADILERDWLYWLDELKSFTCNTLCLNDFPDTVLVHGTLDRVVYFEQVLQFAQALPQAKLLRMEGCGHAPHWHDPSFVRRAVYE